MRTITLVYERHHYLYRWLKPMLAAHKEFKKLGYKIEYQSFVDYFPIFRGGFQKKLGMLLSSRHVAEDKIL